MASIKMNVIRACLDSSLPLEVGAYFLTLIELAGGDYHASAPHPDQFSAVIARVSSELCLHQPIVEPIRYDNADRNAPDDYTKGGKLPTIAEMSGSINFGGRVVIDGDDQVVLSPAETIALERARLEREVIRCAKLFTKIKEGDLNATWSDRVALADNDLDDAVRKLETFESQHGIETKD